MSLAWSLASERRARMCANHPDRPATALHTTTITGTKLPPQTIYRRVCDECAGRVEQSVKTQRQKARSS